LLSNNDPVSFIATRDADASREFYQEVLGLKLVADEYFALVFDLGGHALRIAKVEELAPAAHTVLGWNVSNLEETASWLVSRGVTFEFYKSMKQD